MNIETSTTYLEVPGHTLFPGPQNMRTCEHWTVEFLGVLEDQLEDQEVIGSAFARPKITLVLPEPSLHYRSAPRYQNLRKDFPVNARQGDSLIVRAIVPAAFLKDRHDHPDVPILRY